MRTSILALVFLAAIAPDVTAQDPRVKPGAKFMLDFPELGKSMRGKPIAMEVRIPPRYDANKKYPLYCWLGGGNGSNRPRMGYVDAEKFVCIGLPYPAWVGKKSKFPDFPKVWPLHKKMLAKLTKLVPNIHPDLRLIGGFSNGANSITGMLKYATKEFTAFWTGYMLLEGGFYADNIAAMKDRPLLVAAGDKSHIAFISRYHKRAKAAGVDSTLIVFKNTGHSIPKSYTPQIKEWIEKKFLEGFPARIALARLTAKAPETPDEFRKRIAALERFVKDHAGTGADDKAKEALGTARTGLIAAEREIRQKALAAVRALEKSGDLFGAIEGYDRLAKKHAGTETGDAAKAAAKQLTRDPRVLAELKKRREAELAKVAAIEKAGKLIDAIGAYDRLTRKHAGTPVGDTAKAAATRLRKDPRVVATRNERKAARALSLAMNYLRNGATEVAKAKLSEIVKKYAGTASARKAQAKLDALE